MQHDRTDWEFLQERAKRIGFEIVIDERTLIFRPYQNTTAKILTLIYRRELQEFFPRLSSLTQVQQLEIKA